MTWAEFEEKEYEAAAVGELMRSDGSGSGFAFSAGQVLEKVVGYDAVAAPTPAHIVWRILQFPRPPGVRLLPSMWAPGRRPAVEQLPRTPVTLVCQFKRPEYLYGATARQWRFWEEPYFRFARDAHQHRVLLVFEKNAGDDALVRYVAPAFWQRRQLEACHLRSEVIQASGFVSPSRLARHRYWTYLRPGIDGRANPGGAVARFEALEDIFRTMRDRPEHVTDLVPRDTFGDYLQRVGRAASTAAQTSLRRNVQRWESDLRTREPELDASTIRLIGAVAMLSSVVASIGANWLMVDPA